MYVEQDAFPEEALNILSISKLQSRARGKIASDQRAAGLFSLRIRAQALGIAKSTRNTSPSPLLSPLIKSADRMFAEGFPEILERAARPFVRRLFSPHFTLRYSLSG